MSILDKALGPSQVRPANSTTLPQRGTIRVEDGGAGVASDDPVAQETVLDLTKVSGGGSGGTGFATFDFTSDADVSLPNSSWAKQVIRFTDTGAHLTTMRTVEVPSTGGDTRVVHNDTLHALSFSSGAGTTVVPAGTVKVVDARGTDIFKVTGQSLVIDPRDYGDCPGNGTTDSSTAINAALVAAQGSVAAECRLPAGTHKISKPLRINKGGAHLSGSGHTTTVIQPSFWGVTIACGWDQTDFPAVTASGPFSGGTSPALVIAHDSNARHYRLDLTAHGVVHQSNWNGLAAFTVECWIWMDSAMVGGTTIQPFWTFAGTEGNQVGAANNTGFLFGVQDLFVPGGALFAQVQLSTGQFILSDVTNVLTPGAWHHVALTYDGAHVRLFLDGIVAASTAKTGMVLSHYYEASYLGGGTISTTEETLLGPWPGKIGPVRISPSARYTGSYTVPTGPFNDTDTSDLFCTNWNTSYLDLWRFTHGGQEGWAFLSMEFSIPTSLNDLYIHDFKVNSAPTNAGAVWMQNCLNPNVHRVTSTLMTFCTLLRAQSFGAVIYECGGTGTPNFPTFQDTATGGNQYIGCKSQLGSIGYNLSNACYLVNCQVGAWYYTGVRLNGSVGGLIDGLFVDNESAQPNTRGAIYAVDSVVSITGSVLQYSPATPEPLVSSARSSISISGSATQSQLLTTYLVDVVDTLPDGTIRISVQDYTASTAFPATQPVGSSASKALGRVIIEPDRNATSDAIAVLNGAQIEHRTGTVSTTNGTATEVTGATVLLDLHSTYIVDVEVSARDATSGAEGDNWAVFKTSHAFTRKTGLAVDGGVIGTDSSVGSNAGAPPAGWAIALVADGYQGVQVQVIGAAATNIDWCANVVASRISGAHSHVNIGGFTPASLTGFCGWYKGDTGYGAGAWNDQSGVGNNLTLTGTSAGPTLNSHATVAFNGTTDLAKKTSFSKGSAGSISMFAVVFMPTVAGAANGRGMISYDNAVGDGQYIGSWVDSGAAAIGNLIDASRASNVNLVGVWTIVGLTATTGGTQYLYKETTRIASQPAHAPIANSLVLAIGGRSDLFPGGTPCYVAEVVVTDAVMTTTEIVDTVQYYKTRYAL